MLVLVMRNYKHQRGSRPYVTSYTASDLERAMSAVKKGQTVRQAAKKIGIPNATLARKVNGTHSKRHGGQLRLSEECEAGLLMVIEQLTDWKVPLNAMDLRILVKGYLDKRGVVDSAFKENFPGPDWAAGFIKRHKLTKRFADRVKVARFIVGAKEIKLF